MTNKFRAKVYKDTITGRWQWYCCRRAHPRAQGHPTWESAFVSAYFHMMAHLWRTGPHSRACGIRPHNHGTECHPNCVTCHGTALWVVLSGHRD